MQSYGNLLITEYIPEANLVAGSSLARHSCPSWLSHMSRHSLKTAPLSSKNAPMDSTALPPSRLRIFSSVSPIYVSSPTPKVYFPPFTSLINFQVLISLLFSITTYWLSNFRPGATAFFTWVMWLFLDLLAGEALVVLISSIFPNFVVALALTAFANGLWMSVGGFLVSPTILNPFWRYVFHYIDYVCISHQPPHSFPKPPSPFTLRKILRSVYTR